MISRRNLILVLAITVGGAVAAGAWHRSLGARNRVPAEHDATKAISSPGRAIAAAPVRAGRDELVIP
ncbi:MAG TPA: hypothetical protein VM510_07870, partial [Caulifigura sp.]|nr:hypothetical protein [Caulifigura sp.]